MNLGEVVHVKATLSYISYWGDQDGMCHKGMGSLELTACGSSRLEAFNHLTNRIEKGKAKIGFPTTPVAQGPRYVYIPWHQIFDIVYEVIE